MQRDLSADDYTAGHTTSLTARCKQIAFAAVYTMLICIFNVATAHSEDALMTACKGSDAESAIPACTQVLETNPPPDIAELAYQQRGYRWMAKEDYEKAIADLSKALEIKPEYYAVLSARASSYMRLNKFDLATADFDAALRIKPDFASAYASRSAMDFLMGDMNKTIADASEAIRLDPKFFSAYANRGSARREKGDFENALIDLNTAIRLSPYSSRPLYQRGLTYFRKGDLQSALADYEAAIALNAKETDAVRGRDVTRSMLAARGEKPAGPAAAAAVEPAKIAKPATVQGTRDPTVGTVWKLFEAKKLGVALLVEEAKNPAERFTFEEKGDWIDRRPPPNSGGTSTTHFIRVLRKPAYQPVDQAIRQSFVETLPPTAKASCRVRQLLDSRAASPTTLLFEIAPTGRYADKIDAKLKDNPPTSQADGGCGDYGIGEATVYFEFHPAESTEKYLFVNAGFDMGFDEKSIKILPSGDAPAAPVAKAAQTETSRDVASQIWSVSLGQDPSGILFCEAVARGRNNPAGGDYSIRYRFEAQQSGKLIVTYAKPRMEHADTIETVLDEKPMESYPAQQIMFGSENAVVAAIDPAAFKNRTLKAFEKPDAVLFRIEAGARTFDVPVSGYVAINANLDACMTRLAKNPD